MSKPSVAAFGAGLLFATALRATESLRPEEERIYDARFTYKLLPPAWRGLLLPGIRHALIALLSARAPGTLGMLLCRTRFIDDALIDFLLEGAEQVVCLGAGFEDRAYRIPGIERTRVFELDLPAPQQFKREHLRKRFGELPEHVTFVPIDFDRESIEDEMASAGYRDGVRTFYTWEGVTQYISAEAVDATLGFAHRAAPGSQIAFTYIHRGIIDGSARSELDQRLVSTVQRRGMPWTFGLDPAELEGWLAVRGFRLVDRADAAAYRARYLTPVGRQMDIYPGERMALAAVVDTADEP